MSKISEQKALEAYPILFSERNGYDNTLKDRRESYTKGYDQAMQDFLEKACGFLNDLGNKYLMFSLETKLADLPTHVMVEQFKNYMENESEN